MVARGSASIVALRASGKGLVIETLRYADELQNPDAFYTEVPEAEPEEELLDLATELIERKVKPFDAKVFKNQYDIALRELIDAKLENRRPHEMADRRPVMRDVWERINWGKGMGCVNAGNWMRWKIRRFWLRFVEMTYMRPLFFRNFLICHKLIFWTAPPQEKREFPPLRR